MANGNPYGSWGYGSTVLPNLGEGVARVMQAENERQYQELQYKRGIAEKRRAEALELTTFPIIDFLSERQGKEYVDMTEQYTKDYGDLNKKYGFDIPTDELVKMANRRNEILRKAQRESDFKSALMKIQPMYAQTRNSLQTDKAREDWDNQLADLNEKIKNGEATIFDLYNIGPKVETDLWDRINSKVLKGYSASYDLDYGSGIERLNTPKTIEGIAQRIQYEDPGDGSFIREINLRSGNGDTVDLNAAADAVFRSQNYTPGKRGYAPRSTSSSSSASKRYTDFGWKNAKNERFTPVEYDTTFDGDGGRAVGIYDAKQHAASVTAGDAVDLVMSSKGSRNFVPTKVVLTNDGPKIEGRFIMKGTEYITLTPAQVEDIRNNRWGAQYANLVETTPASDVEEDDNGNYRYKVLQGTEIPGILNYENHRNMFSKEDQVDIERSLGFDTSDLPKKLQEQEKARKEVTDEDLYDYLGLTPLRENKAKLSKLKSELQDINNKETGWSYGTRKKNSEIAAKEAEIQEVEDEINKVKKLSEGARAKLVDEYLKTLEKKNAKQATQTTQTTTTNKWDANKRK